MEQYTVSIEESSLGFLFCSYKHRQTFLAHIPHIQQRHGWSLLYRLRKKYRKNGDKAKGDIMLPFLYLKKWVEGRERKERERGGGRDPLKDLEYPHTSRMRLLSAPSAESFSLHAPAPLMPLLADFCLLCLFSAAI
jgi:hypothetical protein